jgi:predicted GIY-YIG superfamily endonuclease
VTAPSGDYRNPERREHLVYRAFDADGNLLYVGCTNNPDRRWREHRAERPQMFEKARSFRLAGPYNYDTARRLEREALAAEFPRYGMTPQRQSAATRNAALQRKYYRLYTNQGLSRDEALELASARANREVPAPRVGARS